MGDDDALIDRFLEMMAAERGAMAQGLSPLGYWPLFPSPGGCWQVVPEQPGRWLVYPWVLFFSCQRVRLQSLTIELLELILPCSRSTPGRRCWECLGGLLRISSDPSSHELFFSTD